MPSRAELNLRARAVGFDPATIANDSKLEMKVLYLEKNMTTQAGGAGTQTLTSTGVAPADGDTVTVGNRTYTFKTALTAGTANQVLIGASAAIALDNLKAAVNGTGTAGTDYTAVTPVHSQVTATTNTDTTQVFESRDPAVSNASIGTTEASTVLSFGAATLAGGTASVVADATAGVKDNIAALSGDKNVSV